MPVCNSSQTLHQLKLGWKWKRTWLRLIFRLLIRKVSLGSGWFTELLQRPQGSAKVWFVKEAKVSQRGRLSTSCNTVCLEHSPGEQNKRSLSWSMWENSWTSCETACLTHLCVHNLLFPLMALACFTEKLIYDTLAHNAAHGFLQWWPVPTCSYLSHSRSYIYPPLIPALSCLITLGISWIHL